ncbi:hypothetical protein DFH07DRAFT_871769 [Mycena maculata]|uniref:CxC5 like cysteine cluster associated with KDZ domain-containing protein n=1 Tax=Mycena maculata TaxID=230809 RepID=A0AAD7HPZ0_9AGAR|nr:hypothetical protein DFH07DRAFT_871769 [Mycena maculata]
MARCSCSESRTAHCGSLAPNDSEVCCNSATGTRSTMSQPTDAIARLRQARSYCLTLFASGCGDSRHLWAGGPLRAIWASLTSSKALYALAVLVSLYPILRLHSNQMNEARRQNPQTGWMRSLDDWDKLSAGIFHYICRDLDRLYTLLGVSENNGNPASHLSRPHAASSRHLDLDCRFCPVGDRNLLPSLRRRISKKPNQRVWLLDATYQLVSADLIVARCSKCKADYYPDVITQKVQGSHRRTQLLEYDAEYIRVSKQGVWAHRKIALAQEKAVQRLHCGWSNFANWVNDMTEDINQRLTYRQAQKALRRAFFPAAFAGSPRVRDIYLRCPRPCKISHCSCKRGHWENGGVIPGAMDHGCMDCTHVKRYGVPVVNAGGAADVVGSEAGPAGPIDPTVVENPLPPNLPEFVPMQDAPPPGAPLGYERLSVMDGKTVTHKVWPLHNYKNGRFCEEHLPLRLVCGIIPCGLPIRSADAYEDRFHRLNFPGVQRVIRRQAGTAAAPGAAHPVQLQALGDTPGDQVVHTFKAKTIYCLQTIQWACGVPIGWGKCYKSESAPQVLGFLNKVWEDHPDKRPGFIVYDKACELLRHIVTQNINDSWIASTKFIVDAWHYIGHRATDILCRTRCNPAPTNGSQPDLVIIQVDENGVAHQTRAFNTETAEQLNSWISGYESQFRQMTDVNYDFYIHVLMMIYGEMVEKRVVLKNRELTDEFWDEVNGTTMDLDLQ